MQKSMTIKDLPEYERPYEKCVRSGASALSDAELLSVIIRTGSRGEKSVDLANRILNAGPDGLLNLHYLELDELMKLHGIGKVKAVQLKCTGELAKRISMARRHREVMLQDSGSVAAYYMERMRHEPKEILLMTMYDRKQMLLGDKLLSMGTSNNSLISPSEIYKTALLARAEYIILLHNHPSGDPYPSEEDISVTMRIKECGELLGVFLMDHIIIGDNRYFSFREEDILFERGRE